MQVRAYAPEDWPAVLAILHEVVEAGETIAYDPAWTSAQLREVWLARTDGPPAATFVAVDDDGRVVGSATTGPNRPGRGSHVATASFVVARAARGLGVGRALGEHVMAWVPAQGYAALQFNAVVETNAAAVRLWHSLGMRTVGTVPGAFDHRTLGRVGLHVMHRTF